MSVPRDNPELVKAQYEVFARQIPLMYSVLLLNAWALAVIFMGAAPAWLTIYIPAAFSVICIARLVTWWRARNVVPSPELAHRALSRTNRLAALMALTITVWSLLLAGYGDEHMVGNIAFFMAITGVCVVVCLLHLRSAAFIVAISINVPFVLYFATSAIPSFVAMAVNMLFVSAALLLVVVVQSGHFAAAVDRRTKLEAVSQENSRLANIDSLTGLGNRRKYFSSLTKFFADAQANSQRLAVGVIDLDGFKPVNDLYGHAVGDELILEAGRRLHMLMDAQTKISRIGGDEFALAVTDCGDDAELLDIGERICAVLRAPFVLPEATVTISATIGLAVFPDLADDVKSLYQRADYALFHGKRTKRGHATLFTASHILEIERDSRIEQALRKADLNEELSVVFQPIVDTRLNKTVAFEALARWKSSELGEVKPDIFVPVAERGGLVSKLTRVLLEKSLRCAASWPENVRLSFNLSTHDISSPDGVVRIVGIILASGVNPKRIDLEITETAMVYDFVQAKAAIETLKSLGCGIALDDFGTGYSSLTQLHALPLTKIKIDRSFVTNIDNSPASYKIVKSLLALSNDMGLDCVIEGVETAGELAIIEALGGHLVQGFYYSRALRAQEVPEFLASSKLAQSA